MPVTVFILGCGIMQIPALRIAREMGWRVAAADRDPDSPGRELCDMFFPIDLADEEGLIQTAYKIRKEGALDGVFTAGTDFSTSAARVAKTLKLPGHSFPAACRATDKVLMRHALRDFGLPTPEFAEVGPLDDPEGAASMIPGPWVVKPVDSMGARGVKRIDDTASLAAALEEARLFSRSNRALVESYLEGPEFSLDALVEGGNLLFCGLADRHIFFPPHFIEIGHTIPADGVPEDGERIMKMLEAGVRALGLTHGAVKGDIKFTVDGPVIGEIAARLSGGYMSGWTYPYSSGVEPTRGALRLAVGLSADLPPPSLNLVCAERALIGIDGVILKLEGSDAVRRVPGLKEIFLLRAPGDMVKFPRNNVEKVGNIIMVAETREEAHDRSLQALQSFRLVLDPKEDSTGDYLDASLPFPPDAFRPSPSLAGFLGGMWRRYPPRPSRGAPCGILDLPPAVGLDGENGRDFAGRSLSSALDVLAEEGRIRLNSPVTADGAVADFWKAMIRGSVEGARWFLDRHS